MAGDFWAQAAERLDPTPIDVFALLGYEPCNVRYLASLAGSAPGDAFCSMCPRDVPHVPHDEPRCGHCPQERFHASQSDNLMYGGAAGGGKTKALLMDALEKAHRWARLRVGLFRRTFDELAESLLAEL